MGALLMFVPCAVLDRVGMGLLLHFSWIMSMAIVLTIGSKILGYCVQSVTRKQRLTGARILFVQFDIAKYAKPLKFREVREFVGLAVAIYQARKMVVLILKNLSRNLQSLATVRQEGYTESPGMQFESGFVSMKSAKCCR